MEVLYADLVTRESTISTYQTIYANVEGMGMVVLHRQVADFGALAKAGAERKHEGWGIAYYNGYIVPCSTLMHGLLIWADIKNVMMPALATVEQMSVGDEFFQQVQMIKLVVEAAFPK